MRSPDARPHLARQAAVFLRRHVRLLAAAAVATTVLAAILLARAGGLHPRALLAALRTAVLVQAGVTALVAPALTLLEAERTRPRRRLLTLAAKRPAAILAATAVGPALAAGGFVIASGLPLQALAWAAGGAAPVLLAISQGLLALTAACLAMATLACALAFRDPEVGAAIALLATLVATGAPLLVTPLVVVSDDAAGLIYASLLVSPVAMAASALELDLMRGERLYRLSPIGQRRFSYPTPFAAAVALLLLGAAATWFAARQLGPSGRRRHRRRKDRTMKRRLVEGLGALLIVCLLPARSEGQPLASADLDTPEIVDARVLSALNRGLAYLADQQKEDGSWEHDIGITGLAARAFLDAPESLTRGHEETVDRALTFLAGQVREDGGFYVRDLPNYYTAVALQALVAADRDEYRDLVDGARDFLVSLQADESAGYEESDKLYGGIGYGADLRPDLANLEYALSALREASLPAEHPLWERAIRFVQRSQNRSESNDQTWAGDDGGFVYYPGFSYGGETRSYGSMTYAGLLSYSYAEVDRDDPRVAAALDWIRGHYTVDENPGMGAKALYYYYLVFAKALNTLGEPTVVDSSGVAHAWRHDLGRKLVELQHPEGFWVNEDPAWWQDNEVLVTAFATQTLEQVLDDGEPR